MDRDPANCDHDPSSDGGNGGGPGGSAGICGFKILDVQNLRDGGNEAYLGPDPIVVVKVEPEPTHGSSSQEFKREVKVKPELLNNCSSQGGAGTVDARCFHRSYWHSVKMMRSDEASYLTADAMQKRDDLINYHKSSACETDMESSDPSNNDVPAPRRCILHIAGKPSEKKPRCDLLPFNEKNWSTVQAAAEKRRAKPQFLKSVYYDLVVSLPQSPDENDGYHVSCYQKFTAVTSTTSAPGDGPSDASERNLPHLRSNARTDDDAEPSSSGILPATCLFCNSKRKKKKGGTIELLGSCETLEAGQKIQEAAELLQDEAILSKVIGVDLVAKEAKYHHTCKSAFVLAASRTSNTDQKTDDIPQKKTIAVRNIHEYVEKSVIADKRAELLTSVYERYLDLCSYADESPMHRHSLMRNLTNRFGSKIKVQSPAGKKLGSILYNAVIADDFVRVAYEYADSEERLLNQAALILQKQLLNAPKKDVPENPTLNDVRDGDTIVPQPVMNFFKVLYTGNISDQCGTWIKRCIDSTSQDALFVVQRGRAKPAKHVTLGMAIRSVTGSKKLVQVLNRFGHCLNYSCLEELETATAEAIQERKDACPENTLPGLPTGLAFDNFDEMTQTLSGSNTLHDTMGILYQNLPGDRTSIQQINESTTPVRKAIPEAKKAEVSHCR
uniref:uncharacterized protein isoform X2 n=1 Tax=Myxine glutinosa TaxID=7769 RepID=UPI00358F9BFB